MPVYRLNEEPLFPPAQRADPSGMLAVGGDLSTVRLMAAYRHGIFPWYSEGEPILWWSPDPRCVLFPQEIRISHSMRPVLNSGRLSVTCDRDFRAVIAHCAKVRRGKGEGTWITPEMKEAYCRLHAEGHAHSVEVWNGSKLVGGLYGVNVGQVFSGESMFALETNASKVALVWLVKLLAGWHYAAVDCQVHSDHLESMGAREISRAEYLRILRGAQCRAGPAGSWSAARPTARAGSGEGNAGESSRA